MLRLYNSLLESHPKVANTRKHRAVLINALIDFRGNHLSKIYQNGVRCWAPHGPVLVKKKRQASSKHQTLCTNRRVHQKSEATRSWMEENTQKPACLIVKEKWRKRTIIQTRSFKIEMWKPKVWYSRSSQSIIAYNWICTFHKTKIWTFTVFPFYEIY